MLTDLRHAARAAVRSPSSSGVVVLCLTLGLAVTTTMFGIVNALLLRPLPYADPGRLVVVRERRAEAPGGVRGSLSLPDFADYRGAARAFVGFAAYQGRGYNVQTASGAAYVEGTAVSASLFAVLGVRPLLGRGFVAEEERPGQGRVAIVSFDTWQRLFDGDRAVVGRRVLVNGEPYTVVGVMPEGFAFPSTEGLWTPLTLDPTRDVRGDHAVTGVARLRAGVSLEAARTELDVVARRLEAQYPTTNAGWRPTVRTMRDDMMSEMRPALAIFQAATLLVLLIACANAANVVVARGASRERELAMRAALGAHRGRLLSLVLCESTLLALAAGAIGLLLASWGLRGFLAAIPVEQPAWMDFSTDRRVFAYALGAALLAGLVAGLPAALRASRQALGVAGARSAGGVQQTRTRGALVVAQLALSLVLVIGASLLGRSIAALQRVDPGFDTRGLLTLRVVFAGGGYEIGGARDDAVARTVERLASLPGVRAAAAATQVPMRGADVTRVDVDGMALREDDGRREVTWNAVTPGWFRALGVPVLAGRDFTAVESRDTTVVIVSSAMARSLWPGRSALGGRVHLGPRGRGKWATVVGVVGDVQQWGLNEPPTVELYLPFGAEPPGIATFVVRSTAPTVTLAPAMRAALRGAAPGIAPVDVTPMETVIRDTHWQPKVFSALFGAFGIAALVLAAAGVYGLTAYAVSQRSREIGVRVALGARGGQVVRLVARRGLALTGIGLAVGIALALAVSQVMRRVLFGVTPTDPVAFVAAPLLLALVALAASVVPARRAARVDPAEVLRNE
ncbi:permease [Gemmatirosa kalamazoonensis]|uniref:Permease n=1 Tax=Gemmatirosa kalamazoonensis TaxID=861299 RepID=W0RBJ4_9BACT|nr:ABC transporter permease [Gemmatirosa kalamazoonensis]AHG87822.1 permease [Gemmatirosa kalamazoonensis]